MNWLPSFGVSLLAALAVSSAAAAGVAQADLERAVLRAYEAVRPMEEGETAQYIPALAAADPEAFGIAVLTVDGRFAGQGDTDKVFAIMSAAKPFTLALLLQQRGPEAVRSLIGVEPTGLPFNSLGGVERKGSQPLNPMVNAGAITAVSLLQVDTPEARWPLLLDYYRRFAGADLQLMTDVYQSVSRSNYRNRALTNLLQLEGWLEAGPATALDVYNRQSSVGITARQLAAMGVTLANGGLNPLTGERVLARELVDEVLSMMLMNGFYDESGWWAITAGLPAKSGVGGGVIAVVPGSMAIAAFSPRLNASGNSVRAMAAIQHLSQALRLGLFAPAVDAQ